MRLASTDQAIVELIRPALLPEDATTPPSVAAGRETKPCRPPRRAMSDREWSDIADRADDQRVAPLLYVALKSSAQADQPPASVLERLRMEYLRTGTANLLAQQELAGLLKDFDSEHIPVILLKGIALAETLYSNSDLRVLGDFDLLIHQPDGPNAFDVITNRGYTASLEMAEDFGKQYASEKSFVRGGRQPAQVDVHWHVTNIPYYRERISLEWFWRQTEEIRINGQKVCVFSPEAQLLHLSMHLMLHHQGNGLGWLYDLALLLSKKRETIKWNEVIEAARVFELDQVLLKTFAQVHAVWGVTVPSQISEQLDGLSTGAKGRLLFGVHTASKGENAWILFDVLSLPGIRKKLSFLAHLFFPDVAYMRNRYHFADVRLLPVYYLLRMGLGVRRFFQSAISIAANTWRDFRRPRKA